MTDADRHAVIAAWEAGVITAEQACRALGVDIAGLYDLEMATLERGKALACGEGQPATPDIAYLVWRDPDGAGHLDRIWRRLEDAVYDIEPDVGQWSVMDSDRRHIVRDGVEWIIEERFVL